MNSFITSAFGHLFVAIPKDELNTFIPGIQNKLQESFDLGYDGIEIQVKIENGKLSIENIDWPINHDLIEM